MSEFNDSATQLIAEVDCTADGEELCNEQGMLKTVDSIICSVILSYEGQKQFICSVILSYGGQKQF